MKRVLLILTLAATALVAAGCGSKSSGNATEEALSYVPKDAPVVITVDTDPKSDQWKNVDKILAKFPGSGQIKTSLEQRVASGSGGKYDFDKDIKPILGNDFVVAVTRVAPGGGSTPYVVALKVKDEAKAKKLVADDPKDGKVGGTDIHKSGTSYSALDRGVLIGAGSRADIEAAIKRHDGDAQMSTGDLDKLLAGNANGDALVQIGANLQAAIASSPKSAAARKVKWVAALRNYGQTISAKPDGLQSNFKATTDGSFAASDLPLATGAQAPSVVRRAGEVGFGIRNIAQSWRFAESVGQLTDPSGFGRYAKQKKRASKQLGINIDRDIIGQMTGDASLSVSLDGKVAFRTGLRDPKAFAATLKKAAPRLKRINPKKPIGVSTPKGGKGFYAIAEANGNKVIFGVLGGNFVVASDAARAGQVAAQSPSRVPGAKGAGLLVMDTRSVAADALRRRGQGAAALFAGALGDFVMSAESETSGLTGSFKLNIK